MAAVVVGLTMTAWAKKPDKPPKPPGGGGDPVGTGTIYYAHVVDPIDGASLWSMNPDGSGKTLLPVGGVPSMTRHPAEADRWFLQLQTIPGEFYPITTFPADYANQAATGIDDLEAVGFTGDPNADKAWGVIIYHIFIDGEGDADNPDTFKWYAWGWGGETNEITGVPITGDYQELHIDDSNYLTIKFDFTTGHRVNDFWWIEITKTRRHELFAVREDGLVEVQLTDDPNVQPWRPGDVSRALPSWATDYGVMDGKISYLAQRWGKDAEDKLPVILPLEPEVLEINYDWSPDGTQIVYSILYSADGVRVADAYDEEEPHEWLCGGGRPRWSSVLDDGTTLIAFGGGRGIRTISRSGD
jgi:hypothetical protein